MRRRLFLVSLLLVTLPLPASAGIFFGKKATKPNPQERVPELIKILKTDGDENKRADAAEELRQYDVTQFPDILPTLIDALLNDKKASVRIEAGQSISKIRPVSQAGGRALEKAISDDSSMRVRMQARSALLSYQWAGYRNNGKKDDPVVSTKEPPLAEPDRIPAAPSVVPVRMMPLTKGPALPPVVKPQANPPGPLPLQGPALDLPAKPSPAPAPSKSTEPQGPDLN